RAGIRKGLPMSADEYKHLRVVARRNQLREGINWLRAFVWTRSSRAALDRIEEHVRACEDEHVAGLRIENARLQREVRDQCEKCERHIDGMRTGLIGSIHRLE